MLKRKYCFIILLFICFACSEPKPGESTSISGSFPALAGKTLRLQELDVSSLIPLDSVKLRSEGNFEFHPEVDDAGFFLLKTSEDNILLLLIEAGDKVHVSCSDTLLQKDCTIKNSPESILLSDFELFMDHQKTRMDSLSEVFNQSKDSADFLTKKLSLDSIYNNIYEGQRAYVMDFINKNPSSLASLIVLNRKLGRNSVLDEEKDFIYFHRIDSALMISHPGNKHTKDHHRRVQEIRLRIFDRYTADEKLQPGKKAPNIVVRDTNDKILSLKGLTGQKVLICFWAGWNAKSRKDNRKVSKLYPGLKNEKIEVLGVSLDENSVVWKGALRLDKLPGIQGSDLKGLDSEVMKNYNLPADISYYFLIDEDQKILFSSREIDEISSYIQSQDN